LLLLLVLVLLLLELVVALALVLVLCCCSCCCCRSVHDTVHVYFIVKLMIMCVVRWGLRQQELTPSACPVLPCVPAESHPPAEEHRDCGAHV
jgi:hypothetical protein